MNPHNTVQAWFHGGPADGAVRPVPCVPDGRPPALLMLAAGSQVFVGSSDLPAPPGYAIYTLEHEGAAIGTLWPYRYDETLTAG